MRHEQELVASYHLRRPEMVRHDTPQRILENANEELNVELRAELVDNPTLEEKQRLASEIADVFIYLFALSNYFGIDARNAVREKIAQNETKFPIELFDGHLPFSQAYKTAKENAGEWKPRHERRIFPQPTLSESLRDAEIAGQYFSDGEKI